MAIINNRAGSHTAGIRVTSNSLNANVTITPANLALLFANSSPLENVTSFNINKIVWSGQWTISRANTDLLYLSNTGVWDLSGMGMPLSENNTANLVLTSTSAGNSTIIIEVRKYSDFSQQT